MEPFVLDKERGIFWIEPWREKFPQLLAGFTSRQLVPDDEYGNLAFHVGDDPEHVRANRRILSDIAGVPLTHMTCAIQPHGNRVVEITEALRGSGALELSSSIPDADGLVTKLSETLLTLFYADCVPLYFVDPTVQAVGVAHAGWRGTMQNMAKEMVLKFDEIFGSKPHNIHVVIGPSIGPCCYQVDEHVISEARKLLGIEIDAVAVPDGERHYRLDLKKTNRILLEREGILSSHIEVSHLCTSCHHHWFFSHRKEKGKTGRMAAFVIWKEDQI